MNIYKITNLINKKCYIGLTRNTIEERWAKHLTQVKSKRLPKLYAAILKYGKKNFTIELLDTATTIKDLSDKEIHWIKTLDTIKNGYNILDGGVSFNSDNQYCYWDFATREEKQKYKDNMSPLMQGLKRRSATASSYVGISKHRQAWVMELNKDKKRFRRAFSTEQEAALAYDKMALFLFGSEARTNFPERYTQTELKEYYNHFSDSRPIVRTSPHKYKHVTYNKKGNIWIAQVLEKKKAVFRVRKKTEEEAYLALQAYLETKQSH